MMIGCPTASQTQGTEQKLRKMYQEVYRQFEIYRYPVCRFLVQNVCSSKGRAKSDFFVDLVLSVDGLLSLVKTIYGLLRKCQGLEESYRSPHWRMHFHGDVYTIVDPEIHSFGLLPYMLQNGQTGWFEGSNASFRFTVFNIHADEICPSLITNYPRMEVAPKKSTYSDACLTPSLCDDWISPSMRANARDLRNACCDSAVNGENICDGKEHENNSQSCEANVISKWTPAEDEILHLLLETGYDFQDCWTALLQYAFATKTEAATADHWRQLRSTVPHKVCEEGEDSFRTNDNIISVKHLCRRLIKDSHRELSLVRDRAIKRERHVLGSIKGSTGASTLPPSKRRKVVAFVPVLPSRIDDVEVPAHSE